MARKKGTQKPSRNYDGVHRGTATGRITKAPRTSTKRATKPQKLRKLRNGLFEVTPNDTSMEVASKNLVASPLLRLPAEIRNMIFRYTLTMDVPFIIEKSPHPRRAAWVTNKQENCLGLLSVCRQTYAECALLPFQLNTFVFDSYKVLAEWVRNREAAQKHSIMQIELKARYDWLPFSTQCPALRGLRQVDLHLPHRPPPKYQTHMVKWLRASDAVPAEARISFHNTLD